MSLPPTKLANWPHADLAIAWEPVRGGFSGAAIYRGSIDGILHFALKGWPLHVSGERIRELHRYQFALLSIPFIPILELTYSYETTAIAEGRIWELSHWMPGEPNRESPFPNAKRKAAVVALQSIHGVWKERFGTSLARYPAVLRRLAQIDDFQRWLGSNASRSVDPILATAMTRVPDELTNVSRRLHPWEDSAETFAHYAHINAGLATAAALGQESLHPFVLSPTVVTKLDFVHRSLRAASLTPLAR